MKKSSQRIAIPIWNDCVSNVVDFAHQLMLIDVKDHKDTSHTKIPFLPQLVQQQVKQLLELNVDVLICGTISRPLATMLMATQIEVIPFVTGPADEVLAAYLTGQLDQSKFLQPGCNVRTRRHFCREYSYGHRWRGARRRRGCSSEFRKGWHHHM